MRWGGGGGSSEREVAVLSAKRWNHGSIENLIESMSPCPSAEIVELSNPAGLAAMREDTKMKQHLPHSHMSSLFNIL